MSAPVIEWITPGAGFAPDAAASARRLADAWGRMPDTNSTYRDWDVQMGMYRAWQAWVTGRGPKPPHSRAIHPDESKHCLGLAWDTDDWATPGFLKLAAEHGWIQVLPNDKTERHHLEYQWWRDQHRTSGAAGGGSSKEDDMSAHAEAQIAEIHAALGAGGANITTVPEDRTILALARAISGQVNGLPDALKAIQGQVNGAPNILGEILQTVKGLDAGGGAVDVDALAAKIRAGLAPDIVKALGQKLVS